ncbi:MAG: glycosyltransferase family 39 protein [Verrucomicrobia bacterium]|nr:glycosyltransferase family 39 protein [Verrucomicrobiota bacterium]
MIPGLQEWIHKLEEGVGVKQIKLVAIWLGLAAFITFYNLREFKNFSSPEAMDAAQVGRNLAEGRGYTTRYIRPLSVALLQSHRGAAGHGLSGYHPDLANAPVYPTILAGLMTTLPFSYDILDAEKFLRYQPEMFIAIFNQCLFLILLVSVFRLAKRLFDSPVAWLAVFSLGASDLFWRFSVSGLPTIFLALILCWIVLLLVHLDEWAQEENPPASRFLFLGLAIGGLLATAVLTRYSLIWLVPVVVGFIAWIAGPRRVPAMAGCMVVFLLLISPWLARNYSLSGTLFGTAGFAISEETSAFPGARLVRSLPQNFAAELNRLGLEAYGRKLILELARLIQDDLPKMGGSWLSAFFLPGLLIPFRNPLLNRLRWFLVAAITVLLLTQALGKTSLTNTSPTFNGENLLVLISPFIFIFGSALFFLLLDQIEFAWQPARGLLIAGFALLCSAPLVLTLLPPRSFPLSYPPYLPPVIQNTSKWMTEKELMMSDMPWAVAWYGNRDCVWTTLDSGLDQTSDFYRINDYMRPIQALYLTQITMDTKFLSEMVRGGAEGVWGRFVLDSLLRTNVPSGFPLKQAPKGYLPEQLFLSDRIRWKAGEK